MIGDDCPLEDDEEEFLVYVDFEGMSGLNTFCDEKLELDMIGIDSEHPIMCVNGKYYEGTYEDAVGTYMFFEDVEPVIEDPVFDKTASLKYHAKTRKILKMSRVFVKPRLEVLGDSNHPECIPNMDTIKAAGVPPRYQKDALLLWEEMRNERLEALSEYLEKQRQREEKRQQGIQVDSESDDDNPFAMYKPTAQESDEALSRSSKDKESAENPVKSDSNSLTIIDPGPSTSKDSVAWFDSTVPDSSDNLSKLKPTMQSEDSGYIQIPEKRKPRKDKKKKRKRIDESADDTLNNDSVSSNNLPDCVPKSRADTTINDNLADSQLITAAESEPPNEDNVEKSIDCVNDGVSNIEIHDIQSLVNENTSQGPEEADAPQMALVDKKIEKQRKREAKMNEITERLKKLAAGMDA